MTQTEWFSGLNVSKLKKNMVNECEYIVWVSWLNNWKLTKLFRAQLITKTQIKFQKNDLYVLYALTTYYPFLTLFYSAMLISLLNKPTNFLTLFYDLIMNKKKQHVSVLTIFYWFNSIKKKKKSSNNSSKIG